MAVLDPGNKTASLRADSTGRLLVATDATYVQAAAGAPSGAPTGTPVGTVPMRVDTAANRVYFYIGSTWRYAALT